MKIKDSQHPFFERVYEVVRKIPYGRVTSYGAIANYLGASMSGRMVGWAMNNSHRLEEEIPAHRVVNRVGLLTGRHNFYPETLMEDLLTLEGLVIVENQILDFDKHYWDPSVELTEEI